MISDAQIKTSGICRITWGSSNLTRPSPLLPASAINSRSRIAPLARLAATSPSRAAPPVTRRTIVAAIDTTTPQHDKFQSPKIQKSHGAAANKAAVQPVGIVPFHDE
jgi:hypothetical protein